MIYSIRQNRKRNQQVKALERNEMGNAGQGLVREKSCSTGLYYTVYKLDFLTRNGTLKVHLKKLGVKDDMTCRSETGERNPRHLDRSCKVIVINKQGLWEDTYKSGKWKSSLSILLKSSYLLYCMTGGGGGTLNLVNSRSPAVYMHIHTSPHKTCHHSQYELSVTHRTLISPVLNF